MDCKNIGPDLEKLIDEEICTQRKIIVETHLLSCDACNDEKKRIEHLKKRVLDMQGPQLSDTFNIKLLDKVNQTKPRNFSRLFWPLAASFLLGSILLTYLSKQQTAIVGNDLVIELQSIGKPPVDQEEFHQWTQIDGNLLCAGFFSNGDCRKENTELVGIHQR